MEKNTSTNDKKSTEKVKKPSMEEKLMINLHGVKMKGVVLGGKACCPFGGPLTIEPLKNFKKKSMKNMGDYTTKVPLTMYDLTG